MIKFKLVIFTILISTAVYSQKSIQSTVFDLKNGLALEMVTVRLLHVKDSSLVQGVQTNNQGWFQLTKIKPGNYILKITSVGYREYDQLVKMESKDIILKNIKLEEDVRMLKEFDVKGTAAQVVVKGDTLEYNATAFKTQENAVAEELLKKLPGVEIVDGKITVNGQEVKKIRVDGKKFFDGDIEMATKNLPAEMIEKIQVLEQKSEMAQLTGFEDSETERIINFTTKSNRRNGVFGTVSGGAGVDIESQLRYDGNANLNIMKKNSQTSVVAGVNNVNTARSSRGRGSRDGSASGITETQNIGVNNNTEINKNFKIGGDGSFNHSNNFSQTNTTKESYLKESIFNDSTYNESTNDSYEANLRLEAEWKIDSLTTLIIQPNINYNASNSDTYRDYLYLQNMDTTSYGNTSNSSGSNSLSGGLRLILSRKFPSKKGRSITTSVYGSMSQSESETFNFSNKFSKSKTSIINQYTNNSSDRFRIDAKVSFVEPLWNMKNMLEASLSFSSTSQNSVKDQFASTDMNVFFVRDPNLYANYVEDYSNTFSNRFYRETAELNYRYTEKNYNLMLGVKGEPSQTYSRTVYGNGLVREVPNEVFNFAPNGRFQYNFGRKEFLRFDYRGITIQPSIQQMQPVKNNSNLMQETVGNPGLNAAFNNNIRLMYSTFNDKSFSSFSTWISSDFTKDELVTNRIYDSTGKQYTQTVNSSKTPVSFNGNVMFNTPIIQKRLHFNTSTNLGYRSTYGYTSKGVDGSTIDVDNFQLGDLSFTNRYSASEMLSLTFTHDVIELGLRGSLRYTNTDNNLSALVSETYDWSGRGNVVIRLPFNATISSDISYINRLGYSNFDQSELIWNASIDKTLFKGKGVLSVKWNDILQQQLNIRQTVGDNSVSFSRYNTLTSYFLVSFSYNIRNFKGMKEGDFRERDSRYGPGMRPDGQRYDGPRPERSGSGDSYRRTESYQGGERF